MVPKNMTHIAAYAIGSFKKMEKAITSHLFRNVNRSKPEHHHHYCWSEIIYIKAITSRPPLQNISVLQKCWWKIGNHIRILSDWKASWEDIPLLDPYWFVLVSRLCLLRLLASSLPSFYEKGLLQFILGSQEDTGIRWRLVWREKIWWASEEIGLKVIYSK